jgi:hypothetical protein
MDNRRFARASLSNKRCILTAARAKRIDQLIDRLDVRTDVDRQH